MKLLFCLLFSLPILAQTTTDISQAVIYCPSNATTPERKAAQMLVEEIAERTRITLRQTTTWPTAASLVIAVGQAKNLLNKGATPLLSDANKTDGFSIKTERKGTQTIIWVQGYDPCGTVFGVGWLLRQLHLERDKIQADLEKLSVATAPQTTLRGHQLGYRATPNSYDGWDLHQWEQYFRDLVIFGANAVELIPPVSDTAPDSPHFPLPAQQMMIGMSQLAADYGLEVWVWYPALEDNYGNPATVQKAVAEWSGVLKQLPKLNAILVPCGDPGHTPPELLLPMLEKQAAELNKYHKNVQWWISPQGFSEERLSILKPLLEKNPPWLTGLAYGPWMRQSLAEFRQWTPARYPIRHYPDITHSHRCQYPVPDWDYAFVITQHREPINPRPQDMATIYRGSAPYTMGYITYSEGCNDDVNKAIWSALGWKINQNIDQTLLEYSRYFIGPAFAERFAEGLRRLEKNWRGPAATNEGIDSTLALFRQMELEATPQLLQNWRFQQGLFRAYYDAYIRQRVRYEQQIEKNVLNLLATAPQWGSTTVIQQAESQLLLPDVQPVALPLKIRVHELGEALFQSIKMQMWVKRHAAVRTDGATLERLETPLNNRPYLLQEFAKIKTLPNETDRLTQLRQLVVMLQPPADSPNMYYDDLGNPARQPHLVKGQPYAQDPDFLRTPLVINEQRSGKNAAFPLSWYSHLMGLYDQTLQLRYDDLDPKARYKVKIVYASGPVRMLANGIEIHPLLTKPFEILEYSLPIDISKTGQLVLGWQGTPRAGESGRGNQVSEVWLIKE
ncbi:MAG: hypothetical protein ACK4GN_06600 [Runella sp.]